MARFIVSIDPGRCTGVAVYWFIEALGWRLIAASMLETGGTSVSTQATELREQFVSNVWQPIIAPRGANPWEGIATAELMEWRPGVEKSNPTDLIQVATLAGVLAGTVANQLRFVTPNAWKASVSKPIMDLRIRGFLTPEELSVIASGEKVYGKKFHNVMDAIGIGLFACGRMQRGGV